MIKGIKSLNPLIGRKVSSLSAVHDAVVDGKLSVNNLRGDETMHLIDTLADVVEDSLENEDKLSAKDKKMLCAITAVLGNEVGLPTVQVLMGSVVKACRIRILGVLNRLLSVSWISKKELDSCFSRGLCKCFELEDVDVMSMAFCCLSIGIEAQEDPAQCLLMCSQGGTGGGSAYASMGLIIPFTCNLLKQLPQPPSHNYFPFLRLFDHFAWILHSCRRLISSGGVPASGGGGSSAPSLSSQMSFAQISMLFSNIQCIVESFLMPLSELVRSKIPAVSYSAANLIIILLKETDNPKYCSSIQVLCEVCPLFIQCYGGCYGSLQMCMLLPYAIRIDAATMVSCYGYYLRLWS